MNLKADQKKYLEETLKDFFRRNASLFKLQMAFLYGSRAEGYPREDSDIDIGVLFADEIKSEDEMFDLATKISVCLSKEMKAETNVLPICPDFRKPMLYYNVIVKGIPLYIGDYGRYLDLRNEAIYQMEDFEIFGKGWQLLIAKRNLADLEDAGI
jgi:predicted nucleotidyltransferase